MRATGWQRLELRTRLEAQLLAKKPVSAGFFVEDLPHACVKRPSVASRHGWLVGLRGSWTEPLHRPPRA